MKNVKERVLFVCVHNSARSQIAEEYLNKLGGDLFIAESAGLEAGKLNPYVIEVLKEEGIDISGKETHQVWDYYKENRKYSYVITVCSRDAEEQCPIFPGIVERINWPFPDPSKFTGSREEILAKTREVRDAIRNMVEQFIEAYKNKQPLPRFEGTGQ